MDDDVQEAKIHIAEQGVVRVNAAHIHRATEGIACIYLDLHSKRAELIGVGSGDDSAPCVYLGANENTLHVGDSLPRENWTEVRFPDFVGWRVFAADGPARYTLAVCLVAPDESPNVKLTGD